MSKVALYARSATVEDGNEIKGQLKELRTFCAKNNYKIVSEYADEGVSGITLNRSELKKLLGDAKKNKFDIVVTKDVDRLSRDSARYAVLRKNLEKYGVKIVFTSIMDSPVYNFLENTILSYAKFEKAMITAELELTRNGGKESAL